MKQRLVSTSQYDTVDSDLLAGIKKVEDASEATALVAELQEKHTRLEIRRACELAILDDAHIHGRRAFVVANALGGKSVQELAKMVVHRISERVPDTLLEIAEDTLGMRPKRSLRR